MASSVFKILYSMDAIEEPTWMYLRRVLKTELAM